MAILDSFIPYFYIIILIISFSMLLRFNSIELSYILLYFETIVIIDLVARYFRIEYQHNFIVFQYGDFFYYSLGVLIVLIQINSERMIKLILASLIFFNIFGLIYILKIGQLEYPDLLETVGGVLIILCTFYYYFELFITEKIENLSQNGMFWIISAYFLYTSGVFFLNLTFDKIVTGIISGWFENINTILTYLYSFVTLIGLYLIYRENTKKMSFQNIKIK